MQIKDRAEDGASAVEYGLLLAGVAAIIAAVVILFGGFTGGLFGNSCSSVRDQVVAAGDPAPAVCQ